MLNKEQKVVEKKVALEGELKYSLQDFVKLRNPTIKGYVPYEERDIKTIERSVRKHQERLFKNPTEAESKLISEFNKIGVTYKFQKAFVTLEFSCIVDFHIFGKFRNLVIELDGESHNNIIQRNKDDYRSTWLLSHKNCRVLRIKDDDMLSNPTLCMFLIATKYMEANRDTDDINYNIFWRVIRAYSGNPVKQK